MKKPVRILIIILLIFTGITAMGGGAVLIYDPTGLSMQFPEEAITALQHSVFGSFLVPGIALFALIGFASLLIAYLTIKQSKYYPISLIYIGSALLFWIIIQLITVKMFSPLQAVYIILGLFFLLSGLLKK